MERAELVKAMKKAHELGERRAKVLGRLLIATVLPTSLMPTKGRKETICSIGNYSPHSLSFIFSKCHKSKFVYV